MTPQCIQAVQQAAGRTLTQAQIKNIDDRMAATMRNIARRDPQAWMGKSADQRVIEGAQQAMADIQAEAALKVQRAQLQIVKTAAMDTRVTDLMASYGANRSTGLVREMDQTSHYVDGVKRDYMRQLTDLVDAAESGQGASGLRRTAMFLWDVENPTMTRDLALEIFANGKAGTGNAIARQGAEAWLKVIESMRQRFNAAGGDVGKLDYGYLPQPHDQGKVRSAGRDAWAQKTLPLLDRSQYMLEDGSRMSDVEVLDVLRASWETISSAGQNKTQPGQFRGNAARANRGSDSRTLHFKDGDSYLGYLRDFGGGSMYDAMQGHVGGLARDIGLVERYGPNPEQQMRLQFDIAERADGELKRVFGNTPKGYWAVLSGNAGHADNQRIADVAGGMRNIEVFGKLQGALLSSVTDLGTFFVTTGFNKLPYMQALRNVGRVALNGDTRDFLTMHGVLAESMVSDLNRWSGDNIRNGWTGRLANSTMKLSLMNAWTDTLRRAFSMTMMNGMARMAKTDWAALTEYDRWRMTSKGITDADWSIIRQAQFSQHRGMDFLTPESIYATGDARAGEVVSKVLGLITDESEHAVLNPDLATQAIQSFGGQQRGTISGELARSVMQFKSFPIAMISRHWRRMLETPQGLEGAPMLANRVTYAGAMMVSLTALGAVAFQTKQIVQGKDPVDMDPTENPRFWLRAMAQGGGLGIVGDLLFIDPAETYGDATATAIKNVAGPVIGSAAELSLKLGAFNVWEAASGRDTHAIAEGIQFARSHTPYVNLWYGKAALDHAGLHALQENMSPGYLSRMRQRAKKDWGQDYWWKPGTGAPDRAPDLGAAVGE